MNTKTKYLYLLMISFSLVFTACKDAKNTTENEVSTTATLPKLKIAENQRYFMTEDNQPFFWLGDTGWLTFGKLNREEIETYFQDRKNKGFNVVQVMVLHSLKVQNVYKDFALKNEDVAQPLTTPGNDFKNQDEYDYWDHVDYTLDVAEKNGIYLAMVPVWGTNVAKGNKVSKEQAEEYAKFLADRFKNRTNIIWLNGGDTKGNEFQDIWNTIGNTIKNSNPDQLMTFHPYGRTDSSENFQEAKWLDFNMFQSGHKTYDQDTVKTSFKEDNFKYVNRDYVLKPTKPTLDGEPSYEGIPHGLHDTLQPKWNDNDVRRYAYWSVFAGAAGYTYGHSAVMQMFHKGDNPAYGNRMLWDDAIDAPGAAQMKFVKKLMLDFPYFERVPDQSLIANQGERYDYLAATRGKNYALIYTYNGKKIVANLGKTEGEKVEASWYNPRNGETTKIGTVDNKGTKEFKPSGKKEDGNDWVLILESK